jgi:signal transduction histidine kinase
MSKTQNSGNWIDRLVDWFIPSELAAEREKRQLARMFLISHLCGPFLGLVVPGTLLFVDPTPGRPTAVLATSITGFWVFPFLLKKFGDRHYNLLCYISVQNLAFCILWSCFFYGGVTSPTLEWVLTIPLLTFCYIGPSPKLRAFALLQLAANMIIFIAAYLIIPNVVQDTPKEALQGLGIVSTFACLAYVAMMALYYRRILDSGAELEVEMRKHLLTAAQLRRATAEAERAGAAKAEFVASMSHELRTPLNAVIGYSQMLLEEAQDDGDEDSIEDLEKIHKAGHHLLHLVNEVLDLSKIEAGKMELAVEPLAVAEFLNAAVEHKRAAAEAKGLTLTADIPAGLGSAMWDGVRVRQAVIQILENAIKFTDSGEVAVTARRQAGDAGERVVVAVRDTGPGIDPQVLPTLFEKFTVAEDSSSSKYGAAGLGLALSLALCKLMGGDIAVESKLGKGSCFTITVPVELPRPLAEAHAEPETPSEAEAVSPELAAA